MERRYLRIRELTSTSDRAGLLPVSAATIWRWVSRNQFPQPVRLSPGCTAWPAEAVEQWLQTARVAGPVATEKATAASLASRRAKAVAEAEQ